MTEPDQNETPNNITNFDGAAKGPEAPAQEDTGKDLDQRIQKEDQLSKDVPPNTRFPTDPKEISKTWGKMTPAKQALAEEVIRLLKARTDSNPLLMFEMGEHIAGACLFGALRDPKGPNRDGAATWILENCTLRVGKIHEMMREELQQQRQQLQALQQMMMQSRQEAPETPEDVGQSKPAE